jgi:hypothetical protein
MTPPRDLHLVPREEPESASGVVKLPPRPGDTLMVRVDLRDRIDGTESAARLAMQVGMRVEGKVDSLATKVDGIDVKVDDIGSRTERIESALLRELPRATEMAREAREESRSLAEVVGKAPDLAALAHASHTDLTPEHIARLDSEAKLGTGLHKRISELSIQLGRIDRRALVGAGIGAAITTHGPTLVTAAASAGWPGIAALVLVVALLCLIALLRSRKAT